MTDVVQEIKSRLNIEDLVAQYVQLKKAGRNFKGLCPFHSEKTPSFVVSPDKQIAYCFGCHKGGDLFQFLQEVESIEFPAAVKILADRAGIQIEESSFAKSNKGEKQKLIEANEAAAKFFAENLWDSKEGEKVLEYLRNRGLKDETIKDFQLGFAPDSFQETYEYLIKNQFDKKSLLDAGLVSRKDMTASKIYDRFRSRLMFPVKDSLGRVVAFGGRALKKGDEPKYLNTSETLVYHKSNVLFAFDKSKQEIKKQGVAVLVEGYMDLLMSWQVGVRNVVAVSGTAFTEGHLKILKRIANKVVFAFDSDGAGFEAAKRAFLLADKIGLQSLIVDLAENKDPADYVLSEADWSECVAQAKPFMEVFLNKLAKEFDVNTIQGKKNFLKESLPFLDAVSSSVEKDFYIRMAASLLLVEPQLMHDELKNYVNSKRELNQVKKDKDEDAYESSFSSQEHLLALLLAFPLCYKEVKEVLENFVFSDILNGIYEEFVAQYNSASELDSFHFDSEKLPENREKAMLLMLFGEEKNAYLGESGLIKEVNKLIDTLMKEKYLSTRSDLVRRIKLAQKEKDKELLNTLMQELIAHNSST